MSQRTDLAGWVVARRRAGARERLEARRNPPVPSESFARAVALIGFAASRHGWPLPVGPEEEADDLAFHTVWARLRRCAGAA